MQTDSSNGNAGWHSIRPWTPPLSLAVREITSVSATFILSSNVSDLSGDLEPTLASLGLIAADEDVDEDHAGEGSSSDIAERKKKSIIADALAKGLSVNVNGAPWQRVFIRIDDTTDEAVIIIYGLMPGRQYDIDLGLVQGDQTNTLRRQVVTEDVDREPEVHTDPDSPSFDQSTSSDPQVSTPSTSPNRTLPSTPPSTTAPLTAEDRHTQLQHALNLLATERETLTASLKTARRDSQKADAALRTEIDILKRASDKNAAAEHRAKQKILSLQEALKRAQTATRDTEELMKEVESMVPGLEKQRAEKEEEYNKIKEEADRVRKERKLEEEKDKKRLEAIKGELTGLTNKLEKFNSKKEKIETGPIQDLEEQLNEIEREIKKEENESYALTYSPPMDMQELTMDDLVPTHPHSDSPTDHPLAAPYTPPQVRQQNTNPGTIGRPSPTTIQRPPPNANTFGHQPQLWSPPRQSQHHSGHNARASSMHQTPTLLINPHRRPSLKSTAANAITSPPANDSTSSSSSPSPTAGNPPITTSTLSSRAPAFEPGRPLKNSGSGAPGSSPVVIQRPSGGPSRSMGAGLKPGVLPHWAGLQQHDGGRVG